MTDLKKELDFEDQSEYEAALRSIAGLSKVEKDDKGQLSDNINELKEIKKEQIKIIKKDMARLVIGTRMLAAVSRKLGDLHILSSKFEDAEYYYVDANILNEIAFANPTAIKDYLEKFGDDENECE